MATVPEGFCGSHRSWLAQCPGQQRLGGPLLSFGQRWWRGGVGHWLILPERAMGWAGLSLPSTNALITRRLRRSGYKRAHLATVDPAASGSDGPARKPSRTQMTECDELTRGESGPASGIFARARR